MESGGGETSYYKATPHSWPALVLITKIQTTNSVV